MKEIGTVVSTKTIRRRLSQEFGLKSSKPAHKPRLTQAIKEKRLDLAKRHASWDVHMWKKVLFSDKSPAWQFSAQKYRVWRAVGSLYNEKYTIPTVKHSPGQTIWGAMSSMGTVGLHFLLSRITINSEKYVNLLKRKLELHMKIHSCEIFMHDSAPYHRSKRVKKFLEQKRIRMLE